MPGRIFPPSVRQGAIDTWKTVKAIGQVLLEGSLIPDHYSGRTTVENEVARLGNVGLGPREGKVVVWM